MRFLFKLSQVVVRAESLETPENWDHLLTDLSLRAPHLVSDDEFLPRSAFRDLLAATSADELARTAVISVCRNFFVTLCQRLQTSTYARNSLARGLSSFDPDSTISGSEVTQVRSF